jgi:fumarate reductase (CoM/CoB) subunit A
MNKGAWIIKNEEILNDSLSEIRNLKKEAISNIKLPEKNYRHLRAALETLNMINVGEVLILASLIRKESRGAHFREDFPEQDDNNWLKNIIIYQENEELKYIISNIEEE